MGRGRAREPRKGATVEKEDVEKELELELELEEEEEEEEVVVSDSEAKLTPMQRLKKRKRKGEQEEQMDDEVSEGGDDEPAGGAPSKWDASYRNKQRLLVFSSRGVTSRSRHLMEDLRKLLPHHKKEVKLDVGRGESLASAVNTIAEIKSCNNVMFFECRKKLDVYLWIGRTPGGPSVKFHVMNIHTMDELKLTGNCMHGSRPMLSFDSQFDQGAQWKLIKALFTDVFGTPRGHPKSKPFVDRVMSFYVADNKVWIRNYQIVFEGEKKGETTSLVEIGPRFVLTVIRIFDGSFGGPTLYQNPHYTSPNAARSSLKRQAGTKFSDRTEAKAHTKEKKAQIATPRDPINDVFLP